MPRNPPVCHHKTVAPLSRSLTPTDNHSVREPLHKSKTTRVSPTHKLQVSFGSMVWGRSGNPLSRVVWMRSRSSSLLSFGFMFPERKTQPISLHRGWNYHSTQCGWMDRPRWRLQLNLSLHPKRSLALAGPRCRLQVKWLLTTNWPLN